jgi:hypothetical protein
MDEGRMTLNGAGSQTRTPSYVANKETAGASVIFVNRPSWISHGKEGFVNQKLHKISVSL